VGKEKKLENKNGCAQKYLFQGGKHLQMSVLSIATDCSDEDRLLL